MPLQPCKTWTCGTALTSHTLMELPSAVCLTTLETQAHKSDPKRASTLRRRATGLVPALPGAIYCGVGRLARSGQQRLIGQLQHDGPVK